jgi:hypothetical protein
MDSPQQRLNGAASTCCAEDTDFPTPLAYIRH